MRERMRMSRNARTHTRPRAPFAVEMGAATPATVAMKTCPLFNPGDVRHTIEESFATEQDDASSSTPVGPYVTLTGVLVLADGGPNEFPCACACARGAQCNEGGKHTSLIRAPAP